MSLHASMSAAAIRRRIERDQTSDQKIVAQIKAQAICENICEYFTQEMWNAWVDAGPDNVFKFIEYAQTEQEAITAELAKVAEWLAPVADPRTPAQIANDLDDADTMQTRANDYPY